MPSRFRSMGLHTDFVRSIAAHKFITRLPDYEIQKIVLIDAAARSRRRAGRMPR